MPDKLPDERIRIVAIRDVPRGYLDIDEVEKPDEIAIKAGTIFEAIDYGPSSDADPRHEFAIEFEGDEITVLSDYFRTIDIVIPRDVWEEIIWALTYAVPRIAQPLVMGNSERAHALVERQTQQRRRAEEALERVRELAEADQAEWGEIESEALHSEADDA